MEIARIDRVHVHYRLPEERMHQQARIDALIAHEARNLLEGALEEVGIPKDADVCIRQLQLRLRIGADAVDEAVSLAWARAWAKSVRTAVDRGDGVVRFATRTETLIAFGRDVERGDLSRAWAWRQLGLWREGVPETPRNAATEWLLSLPRMPERAASVLAALVEENAVRRAAKDAEPGAWRTLAEVLVRAQATDVGVAAAWMETTAPSSASSMAALPSRATAVLLRWRRAFAEVRTVWARRTLAIVALLSIDPRLVRRRTDEAVAILEWLERTPSSDARALLELSERPAHEEQDASPEPLVRREAELPETSDERSERDDERKVAGVDGALAPEMPARRGPQGEARTREAGAERTEEPTAEFVDERPSAQTRFGGLLLLLHLVQTEALDAVAEAVPTRSTRWILHRVALRLCPADERDPAVLAFAGLRPVDACPAEGEAAPTDAELETLDAWRAQLVHSLRERLQRSGRSEERLLAELCARRARIVADRGWFDVHLSLEEVDTAIRRAGLDLDPGFLPWLGVVVRFHYA